MKLKLFFVIFLIFSITVSFSQTYKGIVKDSENKAIPFANVVLFSLPDSTFLMGTTTDNNGVFLLKSKKQISKGYLEVSFIGYETKKVEAKAKLGTIILQDAKNELSEVIVQGISMKVKEIPNGYSVGVLELRKTSNNALDLLKKIPNIKVQGNKISVIGKQKVIVKIGKVVQRLSMEELATTLKGYDASLIDKVDVLLQPPLRYDNNGNTSMIILHTSSSFKDYFGGMIGTENMLGENKNYRYGIYGTLLFNKKNLFMSFSPSANNNSSSMEENTFYYLSEGTKKIRKPSQGNSNYKGGTINLQYEYSSKGNAGLLFSLNNRKKDNIFDSSERAFFFDTNVMKEYTDNNKHYVNLPKIKTTIYTEKKFGKNNNQFWCDLSLFKMTNKSNSLFSRIEKPQNTPFFTYEDKDVLTTSGLSFNLDLSFPLDKKRKYLFDMGVKSSLSNTEKERNHSQNKNGRFQQKDCYRLKEFMVMPYASTTLHFSPKIWIRAGFKTSLLKVNDNKERVNTSDVNTIFLPSLHSSYNLSSKNKIFINLNSGVKYPKFSQLNPFSWIVSENIIMQGNPDVLPERNYSLKLGYSYKGIFSLSGILKHNKDLIRNITTIKNDTLIIRTENAENNTFYGANMSYYYDKIKWFNASLNAYYGKNNYQSLHTNLPKKRKGNKWGVNGYIDFSFNRNKTTAYLSVSYEGKKHTTISTIEPQYNFDIGGSCFFLDRRLSISLSVLNLLSSNYRGWSDREGGGIFFDNKYSYTTAYMSISYKFSSMKNKINRRTQNSNRNIEKRF